MLSRENYIESLTSFEFLKEAFKLSISLNAIKGLESIDDVKDYFEYCILNLVEAFSTLNLYQETGRIIPITTKFTPRQALLLIMNNEVVRAEKGLREKIAKVIEDKLQKFCVVAPDAPSDNSDRVLIAAKILFVLQLGLQEFNEKEHIKKQMPRFTSINAITIDTLFDFVTHLIFLRKTTFRPLDKAHSDNANYGFDRYQIFYNVLAKIIFNIGEQLSVKVPKEVLAAVLELYSTLPVYITEEKKSLSAFITKQFNKFIEAGELESIKALQINFDLSMLVTFAPKLNMSEKKYFKHMHRIVGKFSEENGSGRVSKVLNGLLTSLENPTFQNDFDFLSIGIENLDKERRFFDSKTSSLNQKIDAAIFILEKFKQIEQHIAKPQPTNPHTLFGSGSTVTSPIVPTVVPPSLDGMQ